MTTIIIEFFIFLHQILAKYGCMSFLTGDLRLLATLQHTKLVCSKEQKEY